MPVPDGNRSRFHGQLREHIDLVLHGRGRQWSDASQRERLDAVASAVHRVALDTMRECEQNYRQQNAKRLYYLSMEFLMGRALGNNLRNLEIYDDAKAVVAELGRDDLEDLSSLEPDAALGNGAIGRWAACMLDSLATHHYPSFGYGINYEFGLFHQTFVNGFQHERPDRWLESGGSPWLIERPSESILVPVYGSIAHTSIAGVYHPTWIDCRVIVGVPHDMPIVGYGGHTVNVLRLFSAHASDEFDIGIFNAGDYIRAVQHKINTEAITKILYPSDLVDSGRELRLMQEYFLTACAVRDTLRRFREQHASGSELSRYVAIHLNGANPALTIAELMRVLVDEECIPWDEAWALTVATCSYTYHGGNTEMIHAWPLDLIGHMLPRHSQIIQEIDLRNRREIDLRFPGHQDVQNAAGVVADGNIRMRPLAVIGSHRSIDASESPGDPEGLALSRLYPERFGRILNGITPRRWLLHANRPLATLITSTIGDAWVTDLNRLEEFELFANDASVVKRLTEIKGRNKIALAILIKELTGISVDPSSLMDVHATPFQNHKRQLLTLLHVIARYWSIVEDGIEPAAPRTIVFAGKAAPGNFMAKLLIKTVHSVADVVNADQRSRKWLRIAFLPDYRVTLAEHVIPAAEISEQLSGPDAETTETGCLKAALNGALTVGMRHGMALELCRVVGESNIFMFDPNLDDTYQPEALLAADSSSQRVIRSIETGHFCRGDKDLLRPLMAQLLSPRDPHRNIGHLPSYVAKQQEIDHEWQNQTAWGRKSLVNIARMGRFSCDRTAHEYAQHVWNIRPIIGGRLRGYSRQS